MNIYEIEGLYFRVEAKTQKEALKKVAGYIQKFNKYLDSHMDVIGSKKLEVTELPF